jgi:diaminopimelate epimerase
MILQFEKYHGAGNDFILIDNRLKHFQFTQEQIALLCHRRYGIGADGLILIEEYPSLDFEMKYFNADGGLGSMCGNGGRCAVMFAAKHRIIRQSAKFMAYDGVHEAMFTEKDSVKLSMAGVKKVEQRDNAFILDTGSPHFVKFVDDVAAIDVLHEGRTIRYSEPFNRDGINVNFVSLNEKAARMRTYERGVEDETLSCGTGTVAAAMALAVKKHSMNHQEHSIKAPGGLLKVYFNRKDEDVFEEVWLEGPVAFVFEGKIEV